MIFDTCQLTPENGNAPNGYYYSADERFKLRLEGDTLHVYRQDPDHPEQANWQEVGKILHWQDGQLGLSLSDDPTLPPSGMIQVTGSLLTRVWGGQDAPLLMSIDNGRKSWISASNLDDWLILGSDDDIALGSTGNDHIEGKGGNDYLSGGPGGISLNTHEISNNDHDTLAGREAANAINWQRAA